jgi:hypothetical protein
VPSAERRSFRRWCCWLRSPAEATAESSRLPAANSPTAFYINKNLLAKNDHAISILVSSCEKRGHDGTISRQEEIGATTQTEYSIKMLTFHVLLSFINDEAIASAPAFLVPGNGEVFNIAIAFELAPDVRFHSLL